MEAYEAITSRRSQRQFDARAVAPALVRRLLYAGCLVPAPHHTRPWRYVVLESDAARRSLAEAMGAAWRRDLVGDGVAAAQIETLLARSRSQIEEAPALVLCCLVADGLRSWPDDGRRRAEWSMAVQSMGCGIEAIMVAAHAEGLASYWISAPLFCAAAVRKALDLPEGYEAQALIALGYAPEGAAPRPRREPDASVHIQQR